MNLITVPSSGIATPVESIQKLALKCVACTGRLFETYVVLTHAARRPFVSAQANGIR